MVILIPKRKKFFPKKLHVEVSQAVETPIIKTPIDTPISNFQELEIYSFKTVSFK